MSLMIAVGNLCSLYLTVVGYLFARKRLLSHTDCPCFLDRRVGNGLACRLALVVVFVLNDETYNDDKNEEL